jgi:hypothetical protein
MSLAHNNFRGKIFRSTANSEGLVLVLFEDPLFRQAEISKSDVALVIEEYILWLKISVNYACFV